MSEPPPSAEANAALAPKRLQRYQAVLAAVVGGITAQVAGLVVAVVAGVALVAAHGLRTPKELAEHSGSLPMLALGVLTVSSVMLLTSIVTPLIARAGLRESLGLCRAPPGVLLAAAVGTVGVGVVVRSTRRPRPASDRP